MVSLQVMELTWNKISIKFNLWREKSIDNMAFCPQNWRTWVVEDLVMYYWWLPSYVFKLFRSPLHQYATQSFASIGYVNKYRNDTQHVVLRLWYLLLGPLAGVLINLFGCRQVGILGGLLSGISIALTPLSRNIYYVCVMFGALGGKIG